jgi:hypothetical protein
LAQAYFIKWVIPDTYVVNKNIAAANSSLPGYTWLIALAFIIAVFVSVTLIARRRNAQPDLKN